MKRLLAALTALAVFCSLCGCDSNLINVDGSLAPPALTEQQEAIYQALTRQVGKGIRLCYPQNGNYRSACVIRNLDGEPTEEAIVFYQPQMQANRSGKLRVNILDQTAEGEWFSACDIAGQGSTIDRIDFGRFTDGGFDDLLVGYREEAAGGQTLIDYRYRDGMLTAVFSREYRVFAVLPLAESSPDGLFLADGETVSPSAMLFLWKADGFAVTDAVPLRQEAESYRAMTVGQLKTGETAIFLDGVEGTELMTQVVAVQNPKAGTLMRAPDWLLELSRRTQEVFCDDLDGDGKTEIPVTYPIPGADGVPLSQYYIKWMTCSQRDLFPSRTDFVDPDGQYRLEIPDEWRHDVSAAYLPEQNEMRFYLDSVPEEELLRIRVVQRADAGQNAMKQGYIRLWSAGQVAYLALINVESESEYRFGREELVERFSTML